MAAGFPAGAVFVDVVPSFNGFAGALTSGLVGPSKKAGTDAGKASGDGLAGALFDSLKDLAKPLTKAFTLVGIGAIITKAVVDGIDNEKITDRLAASLGASGPDAAKLGKIAGDLYGGAYGDSMQDVADGLKGILSSGLIDQDAAAKDIEALGAKVFNLSSAFGEDAASISNSAEQLLRTGLVDNANEAFDVLTVGFENGTNKADDLLDTFNEYGVQFKKLGIDGPTALGLLSQGLQGGARDSDLVADAIKEFSIRAVDGSKTTIDGFQRIGLNADEMREKIAAGGPAAQEGLGQVLDGLRAIKDPADRAAAATDLFGTQAEDLGSALFDLNTSTAVAGLGDVTGAADKLGTTLNDNAASNIESFKRQLSNLATSVIGGQLLPVVNSFASFLATDVGPGLAAVAMGAGAVVGPIVAIGTAIGSFIADHDTAFEVLAGAVGGAALAFGAVYAVQQLIAAARFGAFLVQYAAQVGVVNLATKAWAFSTGIVNAVLALNPVTLIVLAIGALIGILVVLFLKNQGFHDFIVGLWGGIKDAIGGAVSFLTDTVFPALTSAVEAIGSFFTGLYNDVILPVFDAIRTAIEFVINLVVGYIKLWIDIVVAVGDGIRFLYDHVVAPVFELIGAVIAAAWFFIRDNVFNPIVTFLGVTLSRAFTTYRDLAVGVFNAVRDGINTAWGFIRDKVFEPVRAFLADTLGPVFTRFKEIGTTAWSNLKDNINTAWTFIRDYIFTPVKNFIVDTLTTAFNNFKTNASNAWTNLKDAINTAWVFIRDNVFSPLGTWITVTVPGYFTSGVEAIRKAWDGLQEVAKAPVRFVVNTVINDGLIDGFNSLAEKFHTTPIDRIKLPKGFATGGSIRGPGTGTSDSILARLSNGEHVWTAKEVDAAGGHRGVLALRDAALHGTLPAFAKGGIVDLGHWFQGLGARVTEHPAFGGVHPVHKGRGHYDGRAIDVNFGPGGENDTEKAFFDRYAQQVRDMGFKVLWRVAGHFNHLHAEESSLGFLTDIGDAIGSAGSSVKNSIASITAPFTNLLGSLKDDVFGSTFGGMVAGAGKSLIDSAVDFVKSKASSLLDFTGSDKSAIGEWDGATGGLSPASARAAGKKILPPGWSFPDLDSLWTKESGWSWSADNPTSSAYGIPQALPGKKMASAGKDWQTNAITQIEWGLGYIADRYGNSTKAWEFSKKNNYYAGGGPVLSYDSGGYLPPGYTTVHNGTGAPEPIFTRAQADALLAGGPATANDDLLRALVTLAGEGNDTAADGFAALVAAVGDQSRRAQQLTRQGVR